MIPRRPPSAPALRAALLLLAAAPLRAQPAEAPPVTVTGEVVLAEAPAAGVPVELRRASTSGSAVVSRTVADEEGRFTFSLPPLPAHAEAGDIYVAAVRFDGVLYSGPAITGPSLPDEPYRIRIHDATPAPPEGAPLRVMARYLVSEPIEGGIVVTDLFELSHDAPHAWAPNPETGTTWSHPLPPGATRVRVGNEATSGTGVRIDAAGVHLATTIPPGRRQLLLQYDLSSLDDLRLDAPWAVDDLQLLVLEPAPPLEFSGLGAEGSVTTDEGRQYRRFVGSAQAGDVIRARPAPELPDVPGPAVALALGMALTTAWIVLPRGRRSEQRERAGGATDGSSRTSLLLEVARIDLELEGQTRDRAAEENLRRRRAALLERLRGTAGGSY